MSACVQFDQNGALIVVPGNLPASQCPAFIVVEPAEYQQITAANGLYALPTTQDFATAWSVGFVLPMTLYLVAWAVASIVNHFK